MTDYSDPYAAPAVPLVQDADIPQLVYAERGTRLGAHLIDSFSQMLIFAPLLALIPMSPATRNEDWVILTLVGVMGLVAVGLIAWQCVWLHQYGQTIGKRALGIRIVRTDGSQADLGRLIGLRFFPMFLINMVFGLLSFLVDSLMIFGEERRCLHDMMADTIVVQA